jgi:hypothetical protein
MLDPQGQAAIGTVGFKRFTKAALKTRIDVYWQQLKAYRYPRQPLRQHPHHRQTVSPPGYCHKDSITVLQHFIPVHRFADGLV